MARTIRLDFPGAWHHVMNRGARRVPVFQSDAHCGLFLEVIASAGLEVHAYALLPDHFHLLVRSPWGNLSRAMKAALALFTQRVNALNGWEGPVFRGRFKSRLVQDDSYLRFLVAHIHLDPVRAQRVARPDEASWTSHRAHLGLEPRPAWLHVEGVAAWFGSPAKMADAVRALHLGKASWPDGLDLDADLPLPAPALDKIPPRTAEPRVPVRVDGLLERVATVTGQDLDALKTVRRGRGANAARRFAVEVLLDEAHLSHREIAGLLGTGVRAIANLVQRRKLGSSATLATWREAWANDVRHAIPEARRSRRRSPEGGLTEPGLARK
jgi:REP element-mobilizing transposase RayT